MSQIGVNNGRIRLVKVPSNILRLRPLPHSQNVTNWSRPVERKIMSTFELETWTHHQQIELVQFCSFIHCNCQIGVNRWIMLALIRREQTDHVIIVVQRWVLLPFSRISQGLISGTSRTENCKKRPISKNVCDGTCQVEYAQWFGVWPTFRIAVVREIFGCDVANIGTTHTTTGRFI